ncbi:MAG: putative ABC transporter permease, partial [Raoultibacter sp.]
YLTSWFMQFDFGIIDWDYSGSWLSIDGRTNGMFMIMWGFLGVVWIKLLLPSMLKLVNLIPWNWRYTITSIAAVLMIANGVMTLMSLDCWYERTAGHTPETPVEELFAEHFDNQFMAERFQSMSIDPSNSTRADR